MNISCNSNINDSEFEKIQKIQETQNELYILLKNETLDEISRYAIINQIANNLVALKDYNGLILFLTDWVQNHPDDTYNAYWLLMTAYAYMSTKAEPIAEYYFDKILREYKDLLVKDKSIHFICLQNLIQISQNTSNRIRYFNQLINRFPTNISITELYLRLALEYEKESEWEMALKSYAMFLAQPDASTIQISGEPNAYKKASSIFYMSITMTVVMLISTAITYPIYTYLLYPKFTFLQTIIFIFIIYYTQICLVQTLVKQIAIVEREYGCACKVFPCVIYTDLNGKRVI